MLEQVIDELMVFAKRRGIRLVFGMSGSVFTEGTSPSMHGKAELLLAMEEDRERESRKGERECHEQLLREIVNLRNAFCGGEFPSRRELTICIDASERCLREPVEQDNDS